jgi:hypothetical protein
MFRKLVSNLPFNPSLLGSVAFYAKRMHAEESLRRVGCGFVVLAMVVQMFAVITPPEKSLAYSSDYIINGLKTRDDILRAWDGKTADKNVSAIYGRFGLSREDIAALPMYPNATIRSDRADYWTMGRTSLSAVSKSAKIKGIYKDSEIPITAGTSTIYLRQLRAWDIVNPYNTYRAFEGTKYGKKFWILVDCGNLTQVGVPPLKKPALEFRKTIDGGPRTLKPGETFSFRFEYRNRIPDSVPAENVMLRDDLDLSKFEIVSPKSLPMSGSILNYPLGTVSYTESFKTALVLTVRLKSNIDNGAKACNVATLKASNAPEVSSGGPYLCITVVNPCPLDSSLSKTDPRCATPVLACTLTNTDVNRTTKLFTMKTKVTSSNPTLTKINSYVYDYGDGSSVQIKKSNSYQDTASHTYKDGSYTATVVVNYTIGTGTAQTDQSVACSGKIESEPDRPLSQTKTARNLTQNLNEEKTASTKAKANDTLEYNLTTHNTYGYARINVHTSDYIGDILEYASLDEAFLKQQGGKFDAEAKTVSWNNQTVAANSNLTNVFRVKLKPKIPATNRPGTMTTSYDCQLSNKFGNQLDIPVDCPLPKSAEYITKRLPNTGPGTSLIIGFTLTTVVAYFFARTRLLRKELELIRTDFAQTGGI